MPLLLPVLSMVLYPSVSWSGVSESSMSSAELRRRRLVAPGPEDWLSAKFWVLMLFTACMRLAEWFILVAPEMEAELSVLLLRRRSWWRLEGWGNFLSSRSLRAGESPAPSFTMWSISELMRLCAPPLEIPTPSVLYLPKGSTDMGMVALLIFISMKY